LLVQKIDLVAERAEPGFRDEQPPLMRAARRRPSGAARSAGVWTAASRKGNPRRRNVGPPTLLVPGTSLHLEFRVRP
jgi:hypothetical protein